LQRFKHVQSLLPRLSHRSPVFPYTTLFRSGSDRYAGQAAAIHADVRGRAAATHGEARARPESLRALAFVAGPESIRRRSVFRDWGYVTPEEGPITGRDPDRPAGAGIGSEEEKGSDAERAIRGRGAARGIHRRRAAEPGALAADVPARRGAGGDRRAAEEAAVAEVPAGPPGGLVRRRVQYGTRRGAAGRGGAAARPARPASRREPGPDGPAPDGDVPGDPGGDRPRRELRGARVVGLAPEGAPGVVPLPGSAGDAEGGSVPGDAEVVRPGQGAVCALGDRGAAGADGCAGAGVKRRGAGRWVSACGPPRLPRTV